MTQREREEGGEYRERKRETDRQTDRQRQIDRQTDIKTDSQTQKKNNRKKDRRTETENGAEINREQKRKRVLYKRFLSNSLNSENCLLHLQHSSSKGPRVTFIKKITYILKKTAMSKEYKRCYFKNELNLLSTFLTFKYST